MDQQHTNIMIASGTPVALLAKAVCEVSHPPRVTQDQEFVTRHRHSQHQRFRPSATVTCRHGPHQWNHSWTSNEQNTEENSTPLCAGNRHSHTRDIRKVKTRCCTNDEPTKTAAQMRNDSARKGSHLTEALQEYRTAKEINSQINEDRGHDELH